MAKDGVANTRIATALGVSRPTVLDWRRRFREDGLDSVVEIREGRGRKLAISARKVKGMVHATLHRTPPGATHWSCRTMAKAQGVSQLTQKRLRRGVFHSVPELVAAIEAYLQHYNENPTPFVWTATADAILEKIGKCTVILETHH
mgnify:FL=1